MAQMPHTPKTDPLRAPVANPAPAAPAAPAPAANPGNAEKAAPTNLSFDDVKEIPGAATRASLSNPFQDKVNHLAKNPNLASSVIVNDGDDAVWARDMIRRAAAAINKGAVTKKAPATQNADGTGEKIPGKVRVYFSIGDKRPRKS